jgi:hypothetical protein
MLPSWIALLADSIGTETLIIILMAEPPETTLRIAAGPRIGKIA